MIELVINFSNCQFFQERESISAKKELHKGEDLLHDFITYAFCLLQTVINQPEA